MDEKKEEGACGRCGCGVGCCGCVCKMLKALALVLLGGAIGFFLGRGCAGHHRMCPMTSVSSAGAATQTPAPSAKPSK